MNQLAPYVLIISIISLISYAIAFITLIAQLIFGNNSKLERMQNFSLILAIALSFSVFIMVFGLARVNPTS